jgi:hypothetical protein
VGAPDPVDDRAQDRVQHPLPYRPGRGMA